MHHAIGAITLSILPLGKKPVVKRKNRKYKQQIRLISVTAKLSPAVPLELEETCKYIGSKESEFVVAVIENYIMYFRGYIDDKVDGHV